MESTFSQTNHLEGQNFAAFCIPISNNIAVNDGQGLQVYISRTIIFTQRMNTKQCKNWKTKLKTHMLMDLSNLDTNHEVVMQMN